VGVCKQEMKDTNERWTGKSLSLMQERTKIKKRKKLVSARDGVEGKDIPSSVGPCMWALT
jgi:hypothetical protein